MKKINIKLKIILVSVAFLVFLTVMGLLGIFGLSKLNACAQALYSGSTIPIAELSDIRVGEARIRLQLRRAQVFRDPAETKAAIAMIRDDQVRISKAWDQYYRIEVFSDKEREVALRIKNLLPQFKSITDEVIAVLETGDYEKAGVIIRKLGVLATQLDDALEQDAALNAAQASRFADASEASFKANLRIIIALIGGGVVIAISMVIYFLRIILHPLSKAVDVANASANGKLENHIAVDSRDEFGQLLEALKKMDQQLSNTVRGIRVSAESVEVASQEIATGNTDLETGVPLFLMQFTGIATPSIHAGFRPTPTRNPHKINHLLTGPFPASTDTDLSMVLTAGKGGRPPKNGVGRDGRMTPIARRPRDVCRWCAYRGPRGITGLWYSPRSRFQSRLVMPYASAKMSRTGTPQWA